MTESLVGSRYAMHVAARGAKESASAKDYYAVHPGDDELDAPADDLVGYVHSYEVGSTVDGPGLRFVAFLTGCLLRCQYCHNPDTWHKHNGHPVTVSRAMRVIGKYANVLKLSKGGVTLSGGEPVVQKAFAVEIFRRCKALSQATTVRADVARPTSIEATPATAARAAACHMARTRSATWRRRWTNPPPSCAPIPTTWSTWSRSAPPHWSRPASRPRWPAAPRAPSWPT